MILFAKEGMGTHYKPADRSIDYVPLGAGAKDFRIVVMDTGTVRPGLEKSTYKIRRSECEEMAAKAKAAAKKPAVKKIAKKTVKKAAKKPAVKKKK